MRDLAPHVGQLRSNYGLNLLSVEALAAAVHLDAAVYLSAPAPKLEAALVENNCAVHKLYG